MPLISTEDRHAAFLRLCCTERPLHRATVRLWALLDQRRCPQKALDRAWFDFHDARGTIRLAINQVLASQPDRQPLLMALDREQHAADRLRPSSHSVRPWRKRRPVDADDFHAYAAAALALTAALHMARVHAS